MAGIFGVFTDKKQFMLMLFTALAYALLLVPFKQFPIMVGITELRPANFIPVAFGIMFGPAAAWGSALGNLIGDMFGTLSAGSAFGFVGNFIFAYVSYAVWNFIVKKGEPVTMNQQQLMAFWLAGFAASFACALVISAGILMVGMESISKSIILLVFITLNNFAPALLIGPIAMKLFYEKAKKAGLVCG